MMAHHRASIVMAWAGLLAACVVQPPATPEQALPPAFETGGTGPVRWPAQQWYRDFGSEELNALIDAAVTANTDLDGARARVLQADARARQAGAAILPSVDFNGSASYLAGHSSHGGGHELDWSAMVSASYEVDFWGKNRASADSAGLMAGAARAERDAVALTMLGGVADGYFQLLCLRERLTVATANRDASQQILDALQARLRAAAASPMDVATQKAALAGDEIAIADLRLREFEARTALSLLLGRPPEHFEVRGQPLDSLMEPGVVPGLPSELLQRRPDIYLAEANLRAGNADVAAARAAMFPSLTLTAAGGIQNPALSAAVQTIEGTGPSLLLGANLLQPIFDHGKLKARRDEIDGRRLELLSTYRAAILAALTDVENSLAAIRQLDQVRAAQLDSVAQSELALEGARARFEAGAGDYLSVLNAQHSVHAARDRLVQYKLARLQALVALCKALGGGWIQPAQAPAAPQSNDGKSGT